MRKDKFVNGTVRVRPSILHPPQHEMAIDYGFARREMHFVPSEPNSWFSLPRGGGVAYAAQEAWIQNETIRVLVLF